MTVRTMGARELVKQARVNRMTQKLKRINELKQQMEFISAELEALERDVVPVLKDYGKTWSDEGVHYTAVAPTRTSYDEAGLRRVLGEGIWKRIEKVSMDRDKLGALVTAGEVKAETVAAHATVTSIKPYVLVTRDKQAAIKEAESKVA